MVEMMRIGIPKEQNKNETRVAIVPVSIPKLMKLGFDVIIEKGAGEKSGYSDSEYEEKGAKIGNLESVMGAELVASIDIPDFKIMKKGQMLACMADSFRNLKETKEIIDAGITLLSLEVIPRRLSKGQSMDVNSSQDNLSGYRAALMGSQHISKMVPMMMTSAGTVRPAKFIVQGAAVAGLQAIATAKRLGAIVQAIDVRLAAKQDTESLGAKFIDVPGWKDAESSSGHASLFTDKGLQEAFDSALMDAVKNADVVITTARLFGANAPKLFFGKENNDKMTKEMKEGSVIVDMNTDTGGNIVGSKEGEIIEKDGVTIVGIPNLCRTIPNTASMLYSNNVTNFVTVLVDEGNLVINQEEQVLTGDEGGISAGYGGILIAENGKIHENHTKLMEVMK
uniref:proton-translocating NAD(P)(+) transhydrogenase n=1 Tax=uncultured marine group II/III euryarchaeote KM3_147_B09 TaxID=1457882 RepID=A0A075GBF0_9EURY|nr:NAD(P)(+) transhydrogenase (AB-specific), alpha subunit (pntA) [uncultured marine group II/III euryarchaeote KM3_147_B09]